MGILFYVVVNIISLSYFITTVSSVEVCSNGTETGGQLILNKTYGSGESCGCSIKLAESDGNSNVTFQSTQKPNGCQYKLMFRLKNKTREYSCINYFYFITFLMTPTDHLYVNLMNDKNTGGLTFNFNIYSDTRVNLSCRSPWTHPNLRETTQSTTTVGENSFHSECTSTSGQTEYTGTTERNIKEQSDNIALPVIVGSSVGGVVLIIIVIIVICLVKRRQQKHQTNQSLYGQSNTDGNISTDGYDNVHYDFNQPAQKNAVEVVIIPTNVPDSLDIDLENSTNGEHVPELYEYAPGQREQTQKQQERVPYTNEDYAVVKKPKKGPSQNNEMELNNNPNKTIVYDDYENIPKDKLNLTREINRIVGPKGDDYTLVNKC